MSLLARAGNALIEVFDDELMETTGGETSMELNLPFVKVKHSIKREKRKD